MLSKILGIASLGEILMSVSLTKKFVESLILVFALASLAALVGGALVIFALYILDILLLTHGLGLGMAALITFLSGSAIVLIIVAAIMMRIKLMRVSPFTISGAELAGTSVLAALRGFYKGLTEKP